VYVRLDRKDAERLAKIENEYRRLHAEREARHYGGTLSTSDVIRELIREKAA
jgi:hypothetical protein